MLKWNNYLCLLTLSQHLSLLCYTVTLYHCLGDWLLAMILEARAIVCAASSNYFSIGHCSPRVGRGTGQGVSFLVSVSARLRVSLFVTCRQASLGNHRDNSHLIQPQRTPAPAGSWAPLIFTERLYLALGNHIPSQCSPKHALFKKRKKGALEGLTSRNSWEVKRGFLVFFPNTFWEFRKT